MALSPKATALAASFVAALGAVSLAQNPTPPARGTLPGATRSPGETLVVGGSIEWIEKSSVSALIEGVIKDMELQVGMEVKKGGAIGTLHDEKAKLQVTKAKLIAGAEGGLAKARAQKELAKSNLARADRLLQRGANFVSKEDYEKAEAELKVAVALLQEAEEKQKIDQADADLAVQLLEEHTIKAPFDGMIIERPKGPGESVRASEPVVVLGKTDRVRFFGYLPFESAYRVRPGMIVDVRPSIEGAELPIEKKQFRGKITYIGPELVAGQRGTDVQIYADVINNVDKELRPGLKADMTVYLDSVANPGAVPPPPADMLKPGAGELKPGEPRPPVTANRTAPGLPQ